MIQRETLAFLTDLAKHNDREWFAAHKDRYEQARADVLALVAKLIPALAESDPEFPLETLPGKCLMRIYRDIRFSKNKAPYKNNFGISFSVKNKSGNGPEYYLQLQPGKSFFAAGYWMPEAPALKKIREEIDYNTSDFLDIITDPEFAGRFTLSEEDTLKKAPKGYDADHPHIQLLKLKSYIVSFPVADKDLFKPALQDELAAAFAAAYPFVRFIRSALND